MKNVSIIYWSGTGNTESMAKAIAQGATSDHTTVRIIDVADATISDVQSADYLALGCPSMGAEVLEESYMEPFVASIESMVTDKPVLLFGSYDWGDGEWMRDWETQMTNFGSKLVSEGLIVHLTPDEGDLDVCKKAGTLLIQK